MNMNGSNNGRQRHLLAVCVTVSCLIASIGISRTSSADSFDQLFGDDGLSETQSPALRSQSLLPEYGESPAVSGAKSPDSNSLDPASLGTDSRDAVSMATWLPEPGRTTEPDEIQLAGWLSPQTPKRTQFTVAGFEFNPYGTIWSDMTFASSRTVPGRFTLWIDSEESQGESAFELDARRSRIGVDVIGPSIDLLGGFDSAAKFEVDFLGNFTTDNQPDVRLRHVYWEAKNENARFLVGQTWDVVSPLLPNTVSFPVLWTAGNIGFRRNQLRLERYCSLTETTSLTFQAALAQNVIQDFATGSSATGVTRETGNWPMIQARAAIECSSIQAGGKTMAIGTSGHIGDTGFDFSGGHPANPALAAEDDVRIRTWSANMDAVMPLTERLSCQGEFFMGSNLSNLLGGAGQGVCPCLRVPIRSIGGWGEIEYRCGKKVTTHVGCSIDDPNDNDSLIGRTKNQAIYTNLFYQFNANLTTGVEVSHRRTEYHNRTNETGYTFVDAPTEPGEAVLIEGTLRYRF
ncbi:putative secreted protein [Rhodopirellula sp. SWK7]|nr:putative secreted protein [Rhodopirellula sp. SWK7]